MLATIIGLIGPILSLVGSIIGDAFLAKWVTAFRVWWRQHAWESLKKMSNDEYDLLSKQFDDLCGDRPDCVPQKQVQVGPNDEPKKAIETAPIQL